jgi:hypothetical protein
MDMLDESKEAVGAVNVVPTQSPVAGLSSKDPEAQAKMREAMKMRGMDYARAGIMGAAAGGQAGAQTMNPLAAFVQGMAAGLQAPAQIYEQKRQQAQSVYDATPFGATHPEVVKDERYSVLAGLPTGIAVKVIGAIAQDAAKVALESQAEQEKMKAAKELELPTPEQAKTYSAMTGLPLDITQNMRVSALEEYQKSMAGDPDKQRELNVKFQTAFRALQPVQNYERSVTDSNTIKSLADVLRQKGVLSPEEQSQLVSAVKNVTTYGGGAAKFSEDTIGMVQNKGRFRRILDAVVEGSPVSVNPEEARDLINAVDFKIQAISNQYEKEKSVWRNTLLKGDKTAQEFVFGGSPSQPTERRTGERWVEDIGGEPIVWEKTSTGKKRVK